MSKEFGSPMKKKKGATWSSVILECRVALETQCTEYWLGTILQVLNNTWPYTDSEPVP